MVKGLASYSLTLFNHLDFGLRDRLLWMSATSCLFYLILHHFGYTLESKYYID